jgi:hypothetical protein
MENQTSDLMSAIGDEHYRLGPRTPAPSGTPRDAVSFEHFRVEHLAGQFPGLANAIRGDPYMAEMEALWVSRSSFRVTTTMEVFSVRLACNFDDYQSFLDSEDPSAVLQVLVAGVTDEEPTVAVVSGCASRSPKRVFTTPGTGLGAESIVLSAILQYQARKKPPALGN